MRKQECRYITMVFNSLHESFTSYCFKIARNKWNIINVFDWSSYCKKNKYRSIADLWISFLYDRSYITSTIIYRRVSSGYFPCFSPERRLRTLLLEETFDFKWQNGSIPSDSKKKDRRKIKAENKSFSHNYNVLF